MKKARLPFPENLCVELAERTLLERQVDPAELLPVLEQYPHPDKKTILLLNYQEQKSLAEIGSILGLTTERIRQKRNSALWDLRRTLYPDAPVKNKK